jgi:hypothetical protein
MSGYPAVLQSAQQCAAVRQCSSVHQYAAVRTAVCGSARGSVCAAVYTRQCMYGSVYAAVHGAVCAQQCAQQCVAVCAAVCGCPAVRAAVCGCPAVRQCAAVRQLGAPYYIVHGL